jgi:ABC-type multidrug transport system ATPase subunit
MEHEALSFDTEKPRKV